MNLDNNVEPEAPSLTYATVPEKHQVPKPGPSANASQGGNNVQQGAEKKTEGVRTKPDFPWGWPDRKDLEKEFAETYTEKDKDEAVERIVKVVKQYSDEMVKRWNEEIDNLLVYAGLFSAILTAFNVQSYILLQPSTPDPTLLMLQQISQQLNSFSVTQTGAFVNSTHPVSFMPVQASPVETWAIWLNSLWFSGLIFSLASASIGIMVKQWIHEYQAGISGDSLEIARLRQYRLNHLEKWHVAEIVAFLPVLLQIALFLFFSGLLILLWHYHSTVALVASVLIGVVTSFVVGTTIMPIIWSDCCYLSPPVYLIFNFAQHVNYGLGCFSSAIWEGIYECCLFCDMTSSVIEKLGDWAWERSCHPVMLTAWRGREQRTVQLTSSTLDVDMTVHAYSTTIDQNHLFDAWFILAGHGVDSNQKHYTEVQKISEQHFGREDPYSWYLPPDVRARELFYSIREDVNSWALCTQSGSYCHSPNPAMYHRLLLALAAAVSKSDVDYLVLLYSLRFLEELFTCNSDTLKLMPWSAVHRVAAAIERQLYYMLHPSDDERSKGVYWYRVFLALDILMRCCFAPVSSWERSPENMHTCMQYILAQDFLQQNSLQEIASKIDPVGMMNTLALILTYLGDSEDAWGCRPAAEELMEAVRTVIETIQTEWKLVIKHPEGITVSNSLQHLKDIFRKCESLGLSKQVVS